MKKLILSIAVVGLTLASCAKDRTCTCTNTYTETEDGVTVAVTDPIPDVYTIKETSKKVAQSLCVSTDSKGTSTNSAGVTSKDDGNKSVCTLK